MGCGVAKHRDQRKSEGELSVPPPWFTIDAKHRALGKQLADRLARLGKRLMIPLLTPLTHPPVGLLNDNAQRFR